MPRSGDPARAAELLLGDDPEYEVPRPELLSVVAPFLHGELLERACDYAAYALGKPSVGTELIGALDSAAVRLAQEGGIAYTLAIVLRHGLAPPLARPVWDAAKDLAHTAEQVSPFRTPQWLAPSQGGLIEAARGSSDSDEKAALYAAAVAASDPPAETLAEVATFAEELLPNERAVLLAWCARQAPGYRDRTLKAVAEAVKGGAAVEQLSTFAAVGLTAPALAPELAAETAELASRANWGDTGLIAEWLEVALPEPPPERVLWEERKKQLAAELEALDEPTRDALVEEYVKRLVEYWGIQAPINEAQPPAAAPPQEERPVASAPPRGGRLAKAVAGVVEMVRSGVRLPGGYRGPPETDETGATPEPEERAESAPRYLNVAVADLHECEVPKEQTLRPNTPYFAQLDVAPRSETSIVVGAQEFEVSQLEPDTHEGYWLEAVVTSADVGVEQGVHRFFLPHAGPSWVCDCSGTEHTCAPDERRPHIHVPFHTRGTGDATLRCTVYHRNHVVQSARVELVIADGTQQSHAQRAEVDYTLSAQFADVEQLPERDFGVLTNETPGGHSVVIKVDGRAIPVNISEVVAGSAIENIRTQLSLITVGRDGTSPQFNERNEKRRDELVEDLRQLATLGARLWERVMPGGRDYEYVRERLRRRSTIQVARVQGAVFPWALVYDIANEAFADWKPCRLLDEWDKQRRVLESYPDECPFAVEHRRNVLCPYGFWGYRHLLEQPPSRALITKIPHRKGARAAVARNLALNPEHFEEIRGCLEGFIVSDCDSREDLIAAIADPLLPLVYFYCHGDTALLADTQEPLPYLEIGSHDRIAPGDFRAWADDGAWNVANWTDVPPLVFINGCSTTAITPEGVVNFVDKLVQVGAAGVVGTEINVAERTAGEIGLRFYGYLAGAEVVSVGQALHRTRIDMLSKGNVSGLAYTPFCSMDLALVQEAA
jgi:hypothetical protein